MELNLQQIDTLLKSPKKMIRIATDKDILYIKNELLLLLNKKNKTDEAKQIRTLINEIHYLVLKVERDDDNLTIFSYEPPPLSFNKRLTITESGWITIEK